MLGFASELYLVIGSKEVKRKMYMHSSLRFIPKINWPKDQGRHWIC